MAIDDATRSRPEYGQLKALYEQMGFSAGGGRNFGASFRALGLKRSGDAWLDRHIGFIKTTMMLQFAAGGLTVVGLLIMIAGGFGGSSGSDLVAVVLFGVAAGLGIWSLLRTKKAAAAFQSDALP